MPDRLPLTVVIPTLNEAANLPACLDAVSGRVHAVVVVDSGSRDTTLEIAEAAGAAVLSFAWNGRFPKKRNWCLGNYAFETDWVLFLDADEVVNPAFLDAVGRALADTSNVGFQLTYEHVFLGRRLRFGDPFRKLALFRREAGGYERIDEEHWSDLDMEVHEHPVLEGPVGVICEPIRHDDQRSMHAYIERHNQYSDWEAQRYLALRGDVDAWGRLTGRQRIKYRLLSSYALGAVYFVSTYLLKGGILDGRAGLALALLKTSYFWQIKAKIDEGEQAARSA